MNNQRGISITNILNSWRIIHTRNKNNLRKGISEHDNLSTLQAIIDDNKNHRKDTYSLFTDTEKCFDRLWLNDACNELNKIGLPEKEVELLRKMNSKAIATIDNQVGYTNEITLHNIVKQGTFIGPILCIVETGK